MKDVMQKADWDQARAYVVRRLSEDLPHTLYYHNLAHTLEDVLPAAERLATAAGISAAETLLLRTAALYHDLGYLVRYRDNEIIATALAATTLPHFGYTPEQIYAINEMIMATHMPQTPHSLLQALLCDVDLDPLGREDFFEVNRRLRLELAIHDHPVSQETWFSEQLHFLTHHTYTTAVARALRNPGKQRNIQLLQECLESLREGRTADALVLQRAHP